jgi:hypothetical protein
MMEKTWEIRGDKIVSVTYYGNDGCGSDETEVDVCNIQDKDYARRIVACVNACAGIDTEVLEAPGPGIETAKQIVKENELLTVQRDELLAALNLVVGISCDIDTIERCESWEDGSPEYGTVITFGKIKQRISKVKSLIEKYHA